MRLVTLPTLAMILGLTCAAACGGESVEDRARVLKAAAQKSAPDAADAATPTTTSAPAAPTTTAPATPAP